ncbi:hypothetical protein OB968_02690 [Bacillus cereus]|nr:hypothetical protein [Bacillus cereus]
MTTKTISAMELASKLAPEVIAQNLRIAALENVLKEKGLVTEEELQKSFDEVKANSAQIKAYICKLLEIEDFPE